MTNHRLPMFTFAVLTFLTIFSAASARAVNISNTWMLPEEDFPVFYRYFRDRISWYEADAVCQFHHANLVTADTSSQYDAIRAYLKELDITDNVWIGLSKKTENTEFMWSDSRMLSNEGHWFESIPVGGEPLCVTMDPTADFLWKPYSCGGPEAASFICELPVPSWALGQKGCLLTELPSLTVLYIPEQMALELTSDCGLDGTKRITCKGNADREEILKQLTCAISNEDDFDDKVSPKVSGVPVTATTEVTDPSVDDSSQESKTTRSWMWTSNTVDGYEMSTRHRRETEDTLSPSETTIYYRKLDVTEPIPAMHVSTGSSYDDEASTMSKEDESSTVIFKGTSHLRSDSQAEKPSILSIFDASQIDDEHMPEDDQSTMMTPENATLNVDSKGVETQSEDIGEYPSAISQGQLFSIIENGTMFDIIELNDTGIDEGKATKASIPALSKNESSSSSTTTVSPSSSSTITPEITNSFTTVAYYKEAPPDSTQVTNKSPKKFDRKSKIQHYKKSDPKKINYLSEKEQRKKKDEQFDAQNANHEELYQDLNKEVEMFPVIASGGPLVKLNRTHRKELPIIDEDEREFLDENPVDQLNQDVEGNNRVEFDGQSKHVEIQMQKKEDTNSSDVFIVTTKFLDEKLGRKNCRHNESTTTFSERHNETSQQDKVALSERNDKFPDDKSSTVPNKPESASSTSADVLIDPKIDLLNKNSSRNNDSEAVQTVSDVEKAESAWGKEEIMSKSLLGEIETITDEVIENKTSEMGSPTSEPLNSEPFPPNRPNRRRKLTSAQRRSYYPYFFSRVLG
ncbi:uncharacterized protein LOC123311595 [Coccinella septempunctata]|uniref:uncharacterized protein LOC123311595 n=1 Tax=Coccinella septempunctata TaxID=41139 RepID=UPI001D05ECD1|nr:uncharacterized protein LOC123311595 [Coccinella septempunctata]